MLLHIEALNLFELVLRKRYEIVNQARGFLDHNDVGFLEGFEELDERVVCVGPEKAAELTNLLLDVVGKGFIEKSHTGHVDGRSLGHYFWHWCRFLNNFLWSVQWF